MKNIIRILKNEIVCGFIVFSICIALCLYLQFNDNYDTAKSETSLSDELSDEEPIFNSDVSSVNEYNVSNVDIEQEVYGGVGDSLINNTQSYYDNKYRDMYNKVTDQSKDISSDYYDFKYNNRDDGYTEFNNIRAIYKYMPTSIDMKIAIKANVDDFMLIDNYGNIDFRISDEGDSILCYIYNKYPDKTSETKRLIYEAKRLNKKVEITGVFQRQPDDLDQFNIFVHNLEIIN